MVHEEARSDDAQADDKPSRGGTALVIDKPEIKAAQRRAVLLVNTPGVIGVLIAPFYIIYVGMTVCDVVLLLVMWALSYGVGASIGLHRYFTHHSFETACPIRWLLAVLGSMAAQGPLIAWVAIHRRHHEYSDRDGDPHSPNTHGKTFAGRLHGLWHAYFGWFMNYGMPNPLHYCPDIIRDRQLMAVSRQYLKWVVAGLVIPSVIGGLVTFSWTGALGGLVWGGMVRLFVSSHIAWSVNTFCHTLGSRPNVTRELSTNNFLLAIPSFGEGWHNNHHAFPASAACGLRWWQIDPGYMVIWTAERLHLVWNVKRPHTSVSTSSKSI